MGWLVVVISSSNGPSCMELTKNPLGNSHFQVSSLVMFCNGYGSVVDKDANFCASCGSAEVFWSKTLIFACLFCSIY